MDVLYKVSGVVIHGENRGKDLGFPTANIRLHKKIPEGIYASNVTINGKIYYAASFVGSAKTFQSSNVKVECYLFDFKGNLYGKWITVKLCKKVRNNKKFDSIEELVQQMKQDVEEIKEFFVKEASDL